MAGEAGDSALSPLPPSGRIVDSVRDALRNAILGGDLRPGEPLSVPELARRLNVSRSPVREAVLQLVGRGLALEQPRRGVVVARVEPRDVAEVHETRAFLEGGAARLCAERADAPHLEEIKAVLDDEAAAILADDGSRYARTNAAFHRAVASGARNRRLATTLSDLEDFMRFALQRLALTPGHMQAGHAEHGAVADAIAVRDPDRAEQLMRAHITATIARRLHQGQ